MSVPLRFQAPCHFCGDVIDTRPKAGNFQYGAGWFQHRTAGGANAVHLRQMEAVYACKFCMETRLKGQAQYQLGLFA